MACPEFDENFISWYDENDDNNPTGPFNYSGEAAGDSTYPFYERDDGEVYAEMQQAACDVACSGGGMYGGFTPPGFP
eukprot:CAMPEP_0197865538 /NCGR_PEP_ID=MMETSP1438-20131217/43725_1 /TAXON_ID=1461541 /ORGANISM="Pterosperma sp., Strain CCMP1384" /LENGTH=76 /DNA_ID=CAMNT_0043484025 /DNA_START=160 /DNA_END=390 /DNA_ORIENTATION=+